MLRIKSGDWGRKHAGIAGKLTVCARNLCVSVAFAMARNPKAMALPVALAVMLLGLQGGLLAQSVGQTVELWPGTAPGKVTDQPEQHIESRGTTRYHHVSVPTITFYPATSPAPSFKPGVLVMPGGGYGILAYDKEGTEIAQWLSSIGVTGIVLKYRVPKNKDGAFMDAQRAMGLIRQNATQWGIDSGRLGVIGFSAGGNLAARLSTNYATRSYSRVDAADDLSCRPDFTMLVYPAWLHEKNSPLKLRPGFPVDSNTPPAILVQTQDDGLTVNSCLAYYQALLAHGVMAELHLFPNGGHGYGMRPGSQAVRSQWPKLFAIWLADHIMANQPTKTAAH
jgi:acetyl esterase/lipase